MTTPFRNKALQLTFYHDSQKYPCSRAIISRIFFIRSGRINNRRKNAIAINIDICCKPWHLCIFAYSFCHLYITYTKCFRNLYIWIHFVVRRKCFRLNVVNQNKWRAHNSKCCSIFHMFFVIFSIWSILIAIHNRAQADQQAKLVFFSFIISSYIKQHT